MAAAQPLQKADHFEVYSQWISANAGSGKTYQLTRQVVRLLLMGVVPERICCITYTKAAAGEMRTRVLKALRELMLADDEKLLKLVRDSYGLTPSPDMLHRARLLFGTVLDSHSGGIQLTTIHGFCQQVLRAFPLEAGVAPHFTVADDMQTAQLQQQVKHRLLLGDRFDEEVASAIALLAERSGEHRFDALVRALLELEVDTRTPLPELKSRLFAHLGADENITEQQLAATFMDCLSDAQKQVFRGALTGLAAEKTAYKRIMGEGIAQHLEGRGTLEKWLETWLTKEFNPRSHIVKGDFGPAVNEVVSHCMASAERYIASRAALALAEESYAAIVLARALQQLYRELKEERGVLDYDDLISRTRELLTLRDMVGWVMSKLDHRIDHLLVDEAQDTSEKQWNIARALVDELVVSNGGEGSSGVPRSLFVVGDEKQSIFSFQGAAPELYAVQQVQLQQLLEHASAPLRTRELLQSWRSAPAVLKAVDEVAKDPLVARALSATGSPPPHEAIRDSAGSVTLHPPIPAAEKTEREAFVIPQEYAITRTTAQLLAERVADQVAKWLADGEWNAGDILILTRNRKPIVQPLLRALQRKGVPVAGIDRLVLSQHLAVKDLLALARWCASTQDDLALAQVLRSPLIGWSDKQLHDAAIDRDKVSLWARVSGTPGAAMLERWRDASGLNAYDFLTTVLEVDGTRKKFVARFGDEVHEILDELKEQAIAMPAGVAPSLANFTAWMGTSDRQIKRELEAAGDHVRVMTVHGAKGLEAPCVLMVDTVSIPNVAKELLSETQGFPLLALTDAAKLAPAWVDGRAEQQRKLIEEYYRLLYVAMTRAADSLHIFAAEPGRGDLKDECWYKVVERALTPVATKEGEALVLRDAGERERTKSKPVAAEVVLPGWLHAKPSRPAKAPTLTPSGLAREPALAPFAKQRGGEARERGVRLHKVLQFLNGDSTREQVAELVSHIAPDWDAKQQSKAVGEVWALLEKERWLWQNPGQAEANISGSVTIDGTTYPVFGQIDRLIFRGDEVVVLDYKTGNHVPADASGVSDNYLLQLKLYGALLETHYPGRRVRPAIIWTANASIMWLDEAVSKTGWERASLPLQTP